MTINIASTAKLQTIYQNDPTAWLVSLAKLLEDDLSHYKRVGFKVAQESLRADHSRLVEMATDLLILRDGQLNVHTVERLEANGFVVFKLKGELVLHTRSGNLHIPMEAA